MRTWLLAALVIPLGLDLYMPVPENNPLDTERIALGQRLFRDPRLSRDGSTSCSTCHDPARAFADGRAKAIGIAGRIGRRHAPALINRGYGRAFFWDARSATLEDQVLKPIEDANEMDFSPDEAAKRVGLDRVALSYALASYVRSIVSGDSAYDRFVNGNAEALSEEQQAGMRIFRGKGNCSACHVGPTFSDEQLHNTGVAWRGGDAGSGDFADLGRAGVTGLTRDRGAFKTPTLREVARTAPYMHDGSLATLDDVVRFYDEGGRNNPNRDQELRPIGLSSAEKRSLIAFLESLTGTITDGVH